MSMARTGGTTDARGSGDAPPLQAVAIIAPITTSVIDTFEPDAS